MHYVFIDHVYFDLVDLRDAIQLINYCLSLLLKIFQVLFQVSHFAKFLFWLTDGHLRGDDELFGHFRDDPFKLFLFLFVVFVVVLGRIAVGLISFEWLD